MLRHLEIRDILLIEHLSLAFQPGLNALTGETGAGKSILLDSLGFVLGWRGRADLVRMGAEQGEVSAEFGLTPDHPVHAILAEAGLPDEGDTLFLRRINTKDGRKTSFVNDRRCGAEVLRQLSDALVELHGQGDDRGLLNRSKHRQLLDQFAGLDLAPLRAAWRRLQGAEKARVAAEAKIEALKAEEAYLRHSVEELEALAPELGEDAALDTRRRQMQAAERIGGDIRSAQLILSIDGAEGQLHQAMNWLERAQSDLPEVLGPVLDALNRSLLELAEAQEGVVRSLEILDFDPHELERVEERLFALRALARKHGCQPDGLVALGDELRGRLRQIEAADTEMAGLEAELAAAHEAYVQLSSEARNTREAAAKRLDAAMQEELAPLKMERALFTTALEAAPAGAEGEDLVAFTAATNPGAPSGPIEKIASGGELSRFLLALKVCLTRQEHKEQTLIFDEIDRGVGGATADAVGRRLASLAQGAQLLVVTHSPQVAAWADHQWRVRKLHSAAQTLSAVESLDAGARVDEIARMISGDTISDAARQAAQSLLSACVLESG